MSRPNSSKRKLRKLVRNPRLFFADLARKRVPGMRTAEQRRKERPCAYLDPTPDDDTPHFSLDALVARIGERYPVLLTVDEIDYKIGLLEIHLVGVLELFSKFATKHGVSLEITMFGRTHEVHDVVTEQLMLDIRRGYSMRVSWIYNETRLLTVPVYLYKLRQDVLVNYERRIQLRHLARKASDELMRGRTGVLHPTDILGVGETLEREQEVDIVYTWVNSEDPTWRSLYRSHFGTERDEDRFLSRDELRYSLRSLSYYCDWVRKIHVVTNCAPPEWLDTDHPKIAWVNHTEVLAPENLPTFNCHAIEVGLLNVPDLAELFVYFNDDVFATMPLRKAAFFDHRGRSRAYFEPNGKLVPDRSENEESWFHARLNAQRMLLEPYGYAATRMHHHCPFAINAAHAREMFDEFSDTVERVATYKQRTNYDVPLLSFLYPHYAQARGLGLVADVDARIMNVGNYREFALGGSTCFLCINDGSGSAEDADFDLAVRQYMSELFPLPAPWER